MFIERGGVGDGGLLPQFGVFLFVASGTVCSLLLFAHQTIHGFHPYLSWGGLGVGADWRVAGGARKFSIVAKRARLADVAIQRPLVDNI